MRTCMMSPPASSVGDEQRSGRTSWLAMAWAEGGWRVMMTWKGVLMTCVCRYNPPHLGLSSASESENASVSDDGASGGDVGVRESYRESGNVFVHFSMMIHVESCHVSNGFYVLSPAGSWLSLPSQINANLRDPLRRTSNIYPGDCSPCRTRTGCHCYRYPRPFFPVS